MKNITNYFVLIVLFCTVSAHAGKIKSVKFETLYRGAYGANEESGSQEIIEIFNQDEWINYWNKMGFPVPQEKTIDFTDYYVVIALDSLQPSSGYSIEITNIKEDTSVNDRPFEITFKLVQPGSAAGVLDVLTRPYHIIKVRK